MRFLVFAGVGECWAGGWHDFAGGFDNETDAVSFAHKTYSDNGWRWHVVDVKEQTIIRSST